ncbi:MAG: peptide/nickel transport system permease protein [Acidimicrobiales bacterium]|jgi:peptide/nickel transport system permease protein
MATIAPTDLVGIASERRSTLKLVISSLRELPLVSTTILIVIVGMAIFAPILAPHDPLSAVEGASQFGPPVWSEGGSWDTPLGTDNLSRDVLSRSIYGARVSVIVGVTGTAVAGIIGMIMGVAAGYFGGWVDSVIMRVVDAWLAIPTLVLAILMAAVLGPSMWNIVFILGIVYWTRYARILRSEVLTLREREFVKLAQVAGASKTRIIIQHIVPNVLNTWLVLASLTVGVVIIAEASLSFLGVGVPAPTAAWGSMLTEGRSALITRRPHLVMAPALFIGLTVLATNMFGDWLRVKLDPKQRNL